MEDEHLAFQEALKQIGITVNLTKVDSATYWQLLGAGQTDIAYRNWWADFADPDNFTAPLFRTGADSDMGWAKPEYDAIIDKAAKLTRMSDRIPLYQDLEKKLIYQDVVQFPLWNTITTVILNPKVRNYYLHPSGVVAYYPVYLAH
jgi:ABC-type transport system substrate-binding protein